MALRVLLADESSTIKKVIQLSLQDFGVEVKSVTVGIDVLSVTKTFRPDVVLADVLLAKRSGYEVCHDLKNDPETSQIPVVLMWSGFMEIDEQKARLCGADRRLEKPFDASALRQIIQDVVAKTQNNPASAFLHFPPLPAFDEPKKATPQVAEPIAPRSTAPATPTHPKIPDQMTAPDNEALIIEDTEGDDEWVQQPIPKPQTVAPSFPLQKQTAPVPPPVKEDEFTEFPLTQNNAKATPTPAAQQNTPAAQPAATPAPQVSENIVREEIQKWLAQHMPDIAERLIRDEINRLLQESEKTIQGP